MKRSPESGQHAKTTAPDCCPHCGGTGETDCGLCEACDATGKIRRTTATERKPTP